MAELPPFPCSSTWEQAGTLYTGRGESQVLLPSSWVICRLGGERCCASELPLQR